MCIARVQGQKVSVCLTIFDEVVYNINVTFVQVLRISSIIESTHFNQIKVIQVQLWSFFKGVKISFRFLAKNQNRNGILLLLLCEKIVLVIEKTFLNSRLNAENLQTF